MLNKNTLKYLYQDLDELIRQYNENKIDRFSFVSEVERLKQANEVLLNGNEDFAELVESALYEKEYEILEQMAKTALENAKMPSSAIKVLILSGAGISAESGVRTFRDSNGLWEEYDVMEVCSAEGFERNPKLVADFYDARRSDLESKHPNLAHETVARLKRKYPDRIDVLTQNVDDLFERAGCPDVIHLHGTLTDLRCEECQNVFAIGYKSQIDVICPACRSTNIRHNVVMFGEEAPMYQKLQHSIDECDVFIVIGTSGNVLNVGWFAQWFEHSLLNNLDPDEHLDPYFKIVYHEKATEAAPKIEAYIEEFFSAL
ncbi:MAG: NAD-dependent deacetylase [Sulfuricurvum sp.]|uniref:SIR2 family NAD-dependent protein deacylase n=1 Tax=Sulfuricurvum sp. TaxID=2025608 RepID=UPI002639F8D0|nr:Sir2 family NAD-dependent protein deacetylase [Sulfuricurvum sp.]MDD2368252.1 NAD-dependent deacetylase [Sulfuricurvum sp.]MDD5117378.1 NAD-dependent deacetylase [Sulfuricurvum sp.]